MILCKFLEAVLKQHSALANFTLTSGAYPKSLLERRLIYLYNQLTHNTIQKTTPQNALSAAFYVALCVCCVHSFLHNDAHSA